MPHDPCNCGSAACAAIPGHCGAYRLAEDRGKILVRRFATLNAAEKFLNRLYGQYNHVQLIRCPFDESGEYAWEVK